MWYWIVVCEETLYYTESIGGRKSIKSSEYKKISEAIYQWYRVQWKKGTPLSRPILKEKALQFYYELKEKEGLDSLWVLGGQRGVSNFME